MSARPLTPEEEREWREALRRDIDGKLPASNWRVPGHGLVLALFATLDAERARAEKAEAALAAAVAERDAWRAADNARLALEHAPGNNYLSLQRTMHSKTSDARRLRAESEGA